MEQPTLLLSHVWNYLTRKQDDAFVFVDKKACMTYHEPFRTVLYLTGDFAGTTGQVTAELHRAIIAMTN